MGNHWLDENGPTLRRLLHTRRVHGSGDPQGWIVTA